MPFSGEKKLSFSTLFPLYAIAKIIPILYSQVIWEKVTSPQSGPNVRYESNATYVPSSNSMHTMYCVYYLFN